MRVSNPRTIEFIACLHFNLPFEGLQRPDDLSGAEAIFPDFSGPEMGKRKRVTRFSTPRRISERDSTSGVAANSVCFLDRGTFWVLLLVYFYLPRSARAYLLPNLSKSITLAAASLVSTPIVHKQGEHVVRDIHSLCDLCRRSRGFDQEAQSRGRILRAIFRPLSELQKARAYDDRA